jgi:ABC-type polysaccharide/polyol phosphate transport system ATPase subunit
MAPVIQFEAVWKSYRVAKQRPFLTREFVRRILQRPGEVERLDALRDVSFVVEAGESVGVIGTNGSGKSTLLSLIARTSYPTRGHVSVVGRVGPLLELGAGFHPDLTGYENIFLNAALLGLSRRQVEARLESIIEYSGIRPFIHAPIQTYSTGMAARLGFAVVAHSNPEILLVDEVLSVGDAEFSVRCEKTMAGFRRAGTTLFLVSHNLSTVRQLCERAIWLHQGQIAAVGSAEEVCGNYAAFCADGGRPW